MASRNNGSPCGCCICFIVILILGGVGVFVAMYLTGAESLADLLPEGFNPEDFIPTFEDFFHEDPYNATSPEDSPRWRNRRQGLQLQLVNALDERWYSYFNQAVQEWDAGQPDVLDLTVSTSRVDPSCVPVQGVMKVCNGNYGDTRWKGINEAIIENGMTIVMSSAKMNEYYLTARTSDAAKQYTMCHEIGHGFGLPHTDERMYNRDTGECMDYTQRPEKNMHPGTSNFVFLQQMYGTRPGTTAAIQNGGQRALNNDDNELPSWVLEAWNDLVPLVEAQSDGLEHKDGWRLKHRSLRGTLHEMDLGEGYVLQVHKLLVTEADE